MKINITSKDIAYDFLTHLCYLKALSLASTFKLCKECEEENIKQARSVLSPLENEKEIRDGIDSLQKIQAEIRGFIFTRMENWNFWTIAIMCDSLSDILQRDILCKDCKKVFSKALYVFTENIKK
jgi:hypothetical protein